MRLLIFITLITTPFTTPVVANERLEIVTGYCDMMATTAELVMVRPQSNEMISDVMNLIRSANISDEHLERYNEIVVRAYEKPLYNTEDHKTRAVRTFRNEIETDCLREHL